MSATFWKLALPVAFLVVGLPAGIAVVMAMGEDPESAEQASDKAAFKSVSTASTSSGERRAEARWERVTTFTGSGPGEESFDIGQRAIQWRADWTCKSGKFRMGLGGGSRDQKAPPGSSCPDAGTESSVDHGPSRLQIQASGPWRVVVRQQVDTALEEPPLAGMTDAGLLARGRFRPIQKKGEGTASLYRLPSGRLALRFEDFYASPSPGLEVWLSRAGNPRSTLAARRADYSNAGRIRSTLGSYNQVLPRGIEADEIDSVVIWCPAVQIAFSAASLKSR